MRLYYRIKLHLRCRRIAAERAAIEHEWQKVSNTHSTHGERLAFENRMRP